MCNVFEWSRYSTRGNTRNVTSETISYQSRCKISTRCSWCYTSWWGWCRLLSVAEVVMHVWHAVMHRINEKQYQIRIHSTKASQLLCWNINWKYLSKSFYTIFSCTSPCLVTWNVTHRQGIHFTAQHVPLYLGMPLNFTCFIWCSPDKILDQEAEACIRNHTHQ